MAPGSWPTSSEHRCRSERVAKDFELILSISAPVMETSLTTSAVSRHTLSVQAAVAGSHKLRVGGGGRVCSAQTFSVLRMSTRNARNLRCITAVLPTKHLFGHTGTMMTRANSRRREAGRLFILPGTLNGPYLHTGIPADRRHRAVAGAGARRQNSV